MLRWLWGWILCPKDGGTEKWREQQDIWWTALSWTYFMGEKINLYFVEATVIQGLGKQPPNPSIWDQDRKHKYKIISENKSWFILDNKAERCERGGLGWRVRFLRGGEGERVRNVQLWGWHVPSWRNAGCQIPNGFTEKRKKVRRVR